MAKNTLEVILSADSRELDAALSKAEKSLTAYGQKIKDIGSQMTTRLSLPIALAGGAAIKMASDFNESLNKVDVAFKSSSNEVKAFSKTTLKSFGIAQGTALDMAALFGDMGTSMGLTTKQAAKMSTSLVGLAGDIASFKNMNIEEVTTALNGVFTGETESLKRLGVVMTEVNLKQFALSQGIKKQYDTMTQAEKTMLRYQYVMQATANAHGDFERTGGGAANQTRKFQESMKELGATFGQVVLPFFTKVVTFANGLIEKLQGLSDGTKTFIVALTGLVGITGPLLYLAGTVLPKVIVGVKLLKTAFANLGNTVKSAGLVGLIATVAAVAMDEQAALGGASEALSKLSDEEKVSTVAIKAKNKELYASIVTYQKLRAEAEKSDAVFKAQTGQNRDTTKQYDKQIEAAKNFILENRKLLKNVPALKMDASGGDLTIGAPTNTEEDLTKSLEFKQKMAEIEKKGQEEIYKIRQEAGASDIAEQDLLYKKLLLNTGEKGKQTLELLKQWFNYDISTSEFFKSFQKLNGVVSNIATPMAVMDEQIRKSEEAKRAEFEKTNLAFQQGVQIQEALSNSMAQVFSNLGDSIVNSMGLAKNGIDGFVGGMMKTLVDLGAIVVKQLAMNLAASLGWGIAGASQSGASTGPAAIFTTPAFIASAIGGITAAFASIPAFADGGIVSGPTMGLVGEYPGAKSNPEIIAPLSKLQGMLDNSDSGGSMTGEFRLKGQDLVLALQRANNQKGRIS